MSEGFTGVLHTIVFHRSFQAVKPVTYDVLDVTLPAVNDESLETLIDHRATALVRQMDPTGQQPQYNSPPSNGGNGRGQLSLQFFEKRRKKTYFAFGKADEEVCWEQWNLDVTLAKPKTDSDIAKVREAMETSLHKAALKVMSVASEERDHIPPITTTESNPFPFQITIVSKEQGWGKGMGLF